MLFYVDKANRIFKKNHDIKEIHTRSMAFLKTATCIHLLSIWMVSNKVLLVFSI
jgi:hypothetical protein